MSNDKPYYPKDTFEEFNTVLDRLNKERKMLCGVITKHHQTLLEPLIEANDFEACHDILNQWDDRNTKVQKFFWENKVKEAEGNYRKENDIEMVTVKEFLNATGFKRGENHPSKRDLKDAFHQYNVREDAQIDILSFFLYDGLDM